MIFAILAAAAPMAAALDLELVCNGEYQDIETSRGQANTYDSQGNWTGGTVTLNRSVMKPGVAKVSVHAPNAQIIYPDGRVRTMKDVVGDDARITGSYKRLGFITWRMEINRMTGDIQVKSGGDVALSGACTLAPAAPTQPKF
ncbi:hypothetical protein [Phenylobacterium sp.]|uniref:hypothetical protein n=1 Tax=Phenylobacterium sp. TaxID=1871053 RepID=UPI003BA93EFA